MSRENVEVVRRAIDCFNRRDLDGALEDVDPEIELDWSRSRGVEAGIYHGHEAVRRFWAMFLELFEQATVLVEEFVECDQHVLVPNRFELLGRDGIQVQAHSVPLATLRDGQILVWRLYQERADAFKAVGLEA